jgi:ribokinase
MGNACLDVIYHLDRLPEPGETLIAHAVVTDLGGKGLNQAIAAKRAGADVHLIAAIGTDSTALKIKAALKDEDMEERGLIVAEGASDESCLLLDRRGENVIVSNTKRAQSLTPLLAETVLKDTLDSAEFLLLQGNLSEETTVHCIRVARKTGVKIAFNPSPVQSWAGTLPDVDLIIANRREADALGSGRRSPVTVVTLGREGCRLHIDGQIDVTIGAPEVEAIAASGAGDVFAGTFVAEWLASGEAERAARLAVLAASDKATRFGTFSAFPAKSAIEAFRRDLPPISFT